jgi:PST family polysaccharide transporter
VKLPRALQRYRSVGVSVASLYGLQIATLIVPLLLLPLLTRRLGPDVWGVLAVQTSLSTVMIVLLEFGFGFGATREAAAARDDKTRLGRIVADLLGARALIAVAVVAVWVAVWFAVPIVREEPAAYWWTLALTIVQGYSPSWFFQAIGRLPYVMFRELAARILSTVLIFALVHTTDDAWLVPSIQFATIAISLTLTTTTMVRRVDLGRFSFSQSWNLLRSNAHLCFTRLVQGFAPMGNTFLLGVVAPGAAPAYAAAERTSNAVRSLLAPVSQVAFPEIVVLYARSPALAQRAVKRILLFLVAGAALMCLVLWLLADVVVAILFGPEFASTAEVFRILLLSVPLFGIVQVVGLQWLLPLKYDRAFLISAIVGAVLNLSAALVLAPTFGAVGMAWALVTSELAVAVGLLIFTELLGPDELRILRRPKTNV